MTYKFLLLVMSQCGFIVAQRLDIESFRPALTLMEEVHGGVVGVLSDLQQTGGVDVEYLAQKIEGLNGQVRNRLNVSYVDTIQPIDREYLQDMLDKIDELINVLEQVDTTRSIDILKESCCRLKSNLDDTMLIE